MKLKEYPTSLWQTAKLRYRPLPLPAKQSDVVVTLTSIPSRLGMLDVVIKSLLSQTLAPAKIVLWLHPTWLVPKRLRKLVSERFEIRTCEGTSSYRKLIPSLSAFPNTTLVTCDDDLLYPPQWLEKLVKAHQQTPDNIVCQAARVISKDEQGHYKPYGQWHYVRNGEEGSNLLPIGFGGVVYPSGCFHARVTDADAYQAWCPKADDLWFKVMHLLNGRMVSVQPYGFEQPIPLVNTQAVSLGKTNIKQDGNSKQWESLLQNLPEIENFISKKEVL